jgi:glycosyltransferase involved in cell wall biosynthesis
MMISVVIPAYNEEKHIGTCLQSLVKQKTCTPFEVIVVDNASSDRTGSIARTFHTSLNLRILKEQHKGRGAARRSGFARAKGDMILSTDADTVLPPDWVEGLSMQLTRSDAAVSGYITWVDGPWWINRLVIVLQPVAIYAYRLWVGHHWLVGSNFAIWADVYRKSGGFNKALEASEDLDLATKVSKLGRIRLVRRPEVTASARRFEGGMYRAGWAYIKATIDHAVFRKSHIALSDVR